GAAPVIAEEVVPIVVQFQYPSNGSIWCGSTRPATRPASTRVSVSLERIDLVRLGVRRREDMGDLAFQYPSNGSIWCGPARTARPGGASRRVSVSLERIDLVRRRVETALAHDVEQFQYPSNGSIWCGFGTSGGDP